MLQRQPAPVYQLSTRQRGGLAKAGGRSWGKKALYLEYSHNVWLVLASFAVALMAGFTGLTATRGVSGLPDGRRKTQIVIAAIALGGGIWSMHFVAMLGLQMPAVYYYDPLYTLISALIAILMAGVALLILHYRARSPASITLAGAAIGLGIPAMHYVGMAGMELCRAVYSPAGIAFAVIASVGLSTGAIWAAYGQRTNRNIIFGTICFGTAVLCVHFAAMAGTNFLPLGGDQGAAPGISNNSLAMIVSLASFAICGGFLLSSVTMLPEAEAEAVAPPPPPAPEAPAPPADAPPRQAPYERDGRTMFTPISAIAAVRAEGHYTILYVGANKLFCPWSISEAAQRLPEPEFIRAHRSYLINPAHVTGFERKKDTGLVFFDGVGSLEKAPVSRSRLSAVRDALGL